MTTINTDKEICTIINVFTVEPEKQKELFENLKEASEKVFKKMPGYISANIHLGDDGTTVTNYAQWASRQDYKNVFTNAEVKVHMKKAADLAIDFKPVTYSTIWTDGNND
ncbi:MAG: antibiotic biosynthesis monooxygenase family protein [Ginsengibacter sp.]